MIKGRNRQEDVDSEEIEVTVTKEVPTVSTYLNPNIYKKTCIVIYLILWLPRPHNFKWVSVKINHICLI